MSQDDIGIPSEVTPLSAKLTFHLSGELFGAFVFVSPNRGDVGCADRGVYAGEVSLRDDWNPSVSGLGR